MRLVQIIIFSTVLVSSAVWAGGGQEAAGASSVRKPVPTPLTQVTHQRSQNEAEVKRLQRDVSKQQSDSERASVRLQRQDEAIAELQKQLHDLRARAPLGKQ